MKNKAAQSLGRLGGKAGTGKVKARTSAQARAAAMARWNKKRKNSTTIQTIDEVSDWAASHAKLPRLTGKPQPVQPFQKKLIRALKNSTKDKK